MIYLYPLSLLISEIIIIFFFFYIYHFLKGDSFSQIKQFIMYQYKINDSSIIKTSINISRLFFSFLCVYSQFYFTKKIRPMPSRYYDISYKLYNKKFKLRFCYKRGPKRKIFFKVYDQNRQDVTSDIETFLGPDINWHHQVYFPKLLGYDALIFSLDDKKEIRFDSFQHIPILNDIEKILSSSSSIPNIYGSHHHHDK